MPYQEHKPFSSKFYRVSHLALLILTSATPIDGDALFEEAPGILFNVRSWGGGVKYPHPFSEFAGELFAAGKPYL